MNFNQCTFIGTLTQDPELRFTQNKTAVTNATIAINRSYKKNDEWQQDTTFLSMDIWAYKAESFMRETKKGDSVLVSGMLIEDRWEDNEGNKRSRHKLRVNNFAKIERIKNKETSKEEVENDDMFEDIPF